MEWSARGIQRVTGFHQTTIINWVRESEAELSEDGEGELPILAELDELQTYVGKKKFKVWVWTASNHYSPGILAITVGERSGKTFSQLWQKIKAWHGYCVYSNFIDSKQPLVLPKTQLTRVEGEKTRVQALFSTIASSNLMLLKIALHAKVFGSAVDALFKIRKSSYSRLLGNRFSNAKS